jgi:hypothetical protein
MAGHPALPQDFLSDPEPGAAIPANDFGRLRDQMWLKDVIEIGFSIDERSDTMKRKFMIALLAVG